MDIYRFTYIYKYIHQYWQISEPYAFICLFSGKWYNYHICTYTRTHHIYCICTYTYTHQNMTPWYVCPQTNHTYVWLHVHIYICIYGMLQLTHPHPLCMWHDSFARMICRIHMHDMTHLYAYIMTDAYVWHDPLIDQYIPHIWMTWLMYKPNKTHTYVWHHPFICVKRTILEAGTGAQQTPHRKI